MLFASMVFLLLVSGTGAQQNWNAKVGGQSKGMARQAQQGSGTVNARNFPSSLTGDVTATISNTSANPAQISNSDDPARMTDASTHGFTVGTLHRRMLCERVRAREIFSNLNFRQQSDDL
jgi:hypothetical protein